jgi:hypothetical protein
MKRCAWFTRQPLIAGINVGGVGAWAGGDRLIVLLGPRSAHPVGGLLPMRGGCCLRKFGFCRFSQATGSSAGM